MTPDALHTTTKKRGTKLHRVKSKPRAVYSCIHNNALTPRHSATWLSVKVCIGQNGIGVSACVRPTKSHSTRNLMGPVVPVDMLSACHKVIVAAVDAKSRFKVEN